MTYAVMMLCRNGTLELHWSGKNPYYQHGMHVITATVEPTEDAALVEADRLRPVGFNRETARYWVVPYGERYEPRTWPPSALPYWGR